MKKVAIRIRNNLQAEGVLLALKKNGGFFPYRLPPSNASEILTDCKAFEPDILLMTVSYSPDETIENCLSISSTIRDKYPKCKTVFLCDENSSPELAERIVSTRQDGKYLAAVLSTL